MKKFFWVCIGILAGLFLSASALAQTYYPFPDTGQTKCYDYSVEIACQSPGQPFYGQDAQYQPRLPRSYTKLGYGGTVLPDGAAHVDDGGQWIMTRDNVTGLIWALKTNASRDHTYTWWDAQSQFIAVLNSSHFGGFFNWRLPHVKELSSLVNAAGDPGIDASWFPKNVQSVYWSSTPYADSPYPVASSGWFVHFISGHVAWTSRWDSYSVRAVRSGPPPQPALVDNLDGTVTDSATGLMWQKCSYGQTWTGGQCTGSAATRTWQQALEAAENLTWPPNPNGYSDWRLPNRNELQSLVDYTRLNPAIDPLFASVSSNYWSSTTYARDTRLAWLVYFGYGGVYNGYKLGSFYVRAVRTGQSSIGSFGFLPGVMMLLLE